MNYLTKLGLSLAFLASGAVITRWLLSENHGQISISLISEPAQSVGSYQRWQMEFTLGSEFDNPFDRSEIAVELTVTSPSQKITTYRGFHQTPYEFKLDHGKEVPFVSGEARWIASFTPTEIGPYQWRLEVKHEEQLARCSGEFQCWQSNSRGFISRSKSDPRFFEYSNGSPFYPMGHVIRSPGDQRWGEKSQQAAEIVRQSEDQGVFFYRQAFKKMRANGENFCSLWLSPWWCGLEWTPTLPGYDGIGKFNQENAARLDAIFGSAEENGIYILVFLTNHGSLSTDIDSEWDDNPYNAQNSGGILDSASDFFASEPTRIRHRELLNYFAARWGQSTSLFMIGLLTECEWVEAWNVNQGISTSDSGAADSRRDVIAWHVDMVKTLRSNNSYNRLISTQFAFPASWGTALSFAPSDTFDAVLSNSYVRANQMLTGNDAEFTYDGSSEGHYAFTKFFENLAPTTPILFAEWGGTPLKNTESFLGAELHIGMWSILMTNAAGVTGYWWWHSIDHQNLYVDFDALSRFAASIDRRNKVYTSAQTDVLMRLGDTQVIDPSLKAKILFNSSELYAYVYDVAANMEAISFRPNSFSDQRYTNRKAFLSLPGNLESGVYEIQYWDTFSGEVLQQTSVVISSETKVLDLIEFRADLAIKLLRRGN